MLGGKKALHNPSLASNTREAKGIMVPTPTPAEGDAANTVINAFDCEPRQAKEREGK